jgi:hypothetical protein
MSPPYFPQSGGGGSGVLQVVNAPNLASDYANSNTSFTDIMSQSITMTTGTKVRAIAALVGSSGTNSTPIQLQIIDATTSNVIAGCGPQSISGFQQSDWTGAMQGTETGLIPGHTYTFKVQGAAVVAAANSLQINAQSDPTHHHASLTLLELP